MPVPNDDDATDSVRAAHRIGEAMREARAVLDDLDATPLAKGDGLFHMQAAAVLDVALRELLDAITAATTPTDLSALTEEEKSFAIQAGVPAEAFGHDAEREREDWLAWSAIRLTHEREELEHLVELTAFDMVPGLSEVLAAFPPTLDNVERFHLLRTPVEELRGLSPLRWLLNGGNVQAVLTWVDDLGYDG